MIPAPGGTVSLASGRRLSFDDVGDPSGRPVFFLHGCPGSRLSRHPDDAIAGRAGVRLISVDRPGYGSSDADPAGDEVTQADDVVALADHLGIGRFAVIAWSSGGPTALALAAEHPDRIEGRGVGRSRIGAAGRVEVVGPAQPVDHQEAGRPVELTADQAVLHDPVHGVEGLAQVASANSAR